MRGKRIGLAACCLAAVLWLGMNGQQVYAYEMGERLGMITGVDANGEIVFVAPAAVISGTNVPAYVWASADEFQITGNLEDVAGFVLFTAESKYLAELILDDDELLLPEDWGYLEWIVSDTAAEEDSLVRPIYDPYQGQSAELLYVDHNMDSYTRMVVITDMYVDDMGYPLLEVDGMPGTETDIAYPAVILDGDGDYLAYVISRDIVFSLADEDIFYASSTETGSGEEISGTGITEPGNTGSGGSSGSQGTGSSSGNAGAGSDSGVTGTGNTGSGGSSGDEGTGGGSGGSYGSSGTGSGGGSGSSGGLIGGIIIGVIAATGVTFFIMKKKKSSSVSGFPQGTSQVSQDMSGGGQSAFGSWQNNPGSGQSASGGWQNNPGNGQGASGSWQDTSGGGQGASGGWQNASGNAQGGFQPNGLRLICVGGILNGKVYSIGEQEITFGRDSASTVRFPADAEGVSRVHGKLFKSNGTLMLMDCGSSYGTYMKSGKLSPMQPVPVRAGDIFYIGEKENCFKIQ